MKKILVALSMLAFFIGSFAQECSKFYPLVEGISTQHTTYDKKGKVSAVMNSKVINVRNEDSKKIATLQSNIKDEDGKDLTETTYEVVCDGEKLSIDFKSMLNANMISQYKDMDLEITGTNVDIPNNLVVGDALADADMNMKINMSGIGMNMSTKIGNRKVVANENVTTPAGTFDCYVITYTTELKMGMTKKSSGKQWISEGVGLVKQEDYNDGGKITSSTVLTAFSK